jgi:hypothetical protein
MTIHYVEQRTPEWCALRLGRLTASDGRDMLATIKSGEAAARRDLRMRLVCERLTGQAVEDTTFQNADMLRGVTLEPEARAAYEAHAGVLVDTRVGFIAHDELRAGCSPDGLVGDGLVELKAPRVARHVGYVQAGTVPPEHRAQLVHQLWIAEQAPWVDFVSYAPALPEHLRLFVARLMRDDDEIDAYERAARAFLAEVDRAVEALAR